MSSRKPNILIIVAHDLGRHLNCCGVSTVRSPNIDALAAEGVRFDASFCTAPQCSPSRASIFTGRYPHNNGVMGLTHDPFSWDLHPSERHLAAQLASAGWYTALYGHQHEAASESKLGFQEIMHGGIALALAPKIEEFFRKKPYGDKPFYMQIGISEPHRPWPPTKAPPDTTLGVQVPGYLVDDAGSRENLAGLQGAIHAMDKGIGEILRALEESGQKDNTIVVMTTDHGIGFPRAKCSLYDPGLETCFIIRWPKGFAGGRVCTDLISNIDYLPTLLDLAGVEIPDNVQGRSFAPCLRAESYEPRDVIFGEMTYHQYFDPIRCIRTRTHKLIVCFSAAPAFMDPSQEWYHKSITKVPPNPMGAFHAPVELYDLENDPLETTNLAKSPEHRDVRRNLLSRLRAWMVETDDPILQGIPISPMHQRAVAALNGEEI